MRLKIAALVVLAAICALYFFWPQPYSRKNLELIIRNDRAAIERQIANAPQQTRNYISEQAKYWELPLPAVEAAASIPGTEFVTDQEHSTPDLHFVDSIIYQIELYLKDGSRRDLPIGQFLPDLQIALDSGSPKAVAYVQDAILKHLANQEDQTKLEDMSAEQKQALADSYWIVADICEVLLKLQDSAQYHSRRATILADVDPSKSALAKIDQAFILNINADRERSLTELDAARRLIEEALKSDLSNLNAEQQIKLHTMAGQNALIAYHRFEDHSRLNEAVEQFRKTMKLEADKDGHPDPSTLNNLAVALSYLGRIDRSLPPMQEALDNYRQASVVSIKLDQPEAAARYDEMANSTIEDAAALGFALR